MSGTLMDGGGQGGDGAAFNSHNQSMGDQVSFDASHGHQSGHQTGHVQAGSGGGDGGFLASLLGENGQHSFLGHLLGLDHGSNAVHGHGAQASHSQSVGHTPSQSVIWTSALQALKMSNVIDGLKFTPAMGMFCLFLGFVIWLWVVYFIRHHEPFANSVLGTVPQSLGVSTDRQLINGVKRAMPFKTSKNTGDFYEPLPVGAQGAPVAPMAPAFAPVTVAPDPSATSSFGSPRVLNEPFSGQTEAPAAFQTYAAQPAATPQLPTGFAVNPYYATPSQGVARPAKLKVFTNH